MILVVNVNLLSILLHLILLLGLALQHRLLPSLGNMFLITRVFKQARVMSDGVSGRVRCSSSINRETHLHRHMKCQKDSLRGGEEKKNAVFFPQLMIHRNVQSLGGAKPIRHSHGQYCEIRSFTYTK